VKGEFEKRLKAVIEAVQQAPKPTITFIDEAHTLIGAGGAAGTSDAANMLKPALARGELRTIAATTWTEYKKYIEKDPALERRFQMVKIDEPDIENAVIMLRGIKSAYEDHHGIPISDEAARTSAEFAARYIAGRQLPDKAVDLIDTASARVRMSQSAKPPALDDAERRLDYLNIEIRSIERDLKTGVRKDSSTLEELHAERDELEEKVAAITERWEKEKDLVRQIVALRQQLGENGQAAPELVNGEGEAVATEEVAATEGDAAGEAMADPPSGDGAPDDPEAIKAELAALKQELAELQDDDPLVFAEVNAAVTAQVVSDWTGIPAGSMEKDEATVLLKLEERLQEDIIGQDEAIGLVADSIRSSKAGMRNPEAPIAVFLFVGPSGVGKTETARMLARRLFGGQRFLTTINMSEYQEKHTVSQLKGSPPGYVGYGEGGILTEAVRQRPYSVVLLDEVEKAHRDVMNLFYQVFDKGFMRDGEGREIDFKNTIIMMTSNLASETITYMGMDEDRPSPDQLREAIHDTLAEHFQPALLARMKVVPFYPLTREPMRQIVEIKLNQIDKRLREAHGIRFTYEEEVVDRVAERCTQVDLGARNIDFIIDKNVLPQASKALIGRMAEDEMPSSLTLGLDEEGNFTYDFDA
jgi:type VI secretion system protein VasG